MLFRICNRTVHHHLRINQRCTADDHDDQHSGQKIPPVQLFLKGLHAFRRDSA